ncbi:MAG TPA: DNA repair protein RadA, partial [Gammaproteobacteria bacterium]|nr:DNA repair protein RadA [Gammaproteobacteria bacterium]
MAKAKTTFVCQSCGGHSVRWAGQCPECGDWNTLVESVVAPGPGKAARAPQGYAGETRVRLLGEVGAETLSRTETGIGELDRVFG